MLARSGQYLQSYSNFSSKLEDLHTRHDSAIEEEGGRGDDKHGGIVVS